MRTPTFDISLDKEKVNVDGVNYHASSVGFGNLAHLNKGNKFYPDSIQCTFGEVFDLLYASNLSKDKETARDILSDIVSNSIIGYTAIFGLPDLVLVQDHPEIRGNKIVPDVGSLILKLGNYESHGVVFSPDKKIRALPYQTKRIEGFKPVSTDQALIALTGDEHAPEKIRELIKRDYKRGAMVLGMGPLESIKPKIPMIKHNELYEEGRFIGHDITVNCTIEEDEEIRARSFWRKI